LENNHPFFLPIIWSFWTKRVSLQQNNLKTIQK